MATNSMQLLTVGDRLHWAYANIAMAHAALKDGAAGYGPKHYSIRSRLYAGLRSGQMSVGTLLDDERLKLVQPRACCYCGTPDELSLDHLWPKKRGGPEVADNVVWACRKCNSAKGALDLQQWYRRKDQWPPVLLYRRYLKLAIEWAEAHQLMEEAYDGPIAAAAPFSVAALPVKPPAPSTLRLWIVPLEGRIR